jgi:hypothetical protein
MFMVSMKKQAAGLIMRLMADEKAPDLSGAFHDIPSNRKDYWPGP